MLSARNQYFLEVMREVARDRTAYGAAGAASAAFAASAASAGEGGAGDKKTSTGTPAERLGAWLIQEVKALRKAIEKKEQEEEQEDQVIKEKGAGALSDLDKAFVLDHMFGVPMGGVEEGEGEAKSESTTRDGEKEKQQEKRKEDRFILRPIKPADTTQKATLKVTTPALASARQQGVAPGPGSLLMLSRRDSKRAMAQLLVSKLCAAGSGNGGSGSGSGSGSKASAVHGQTAEAAEAMATEIGRNR